MPRSGIWSFHQWATGTFDPLLTWELLPNTTKVSCALRTALSLQLQLRSLLRGPSRARPVAPRRGEVLGHSRSNSGDKSLLDDFVCNFEVFAVEPPIQSSSTSIETKSECRNKSE